jgi:hypothetical protein
MGITCRDWERLLLAVIVFVMAILYLLTPMWSVR